MAKNNAVAVPTLEKTHGLTPKPITAMEAVAYLEAAAPYIAFLEAKGQGSVDRDVDSQLSVRQNGQHANGKDIAASFKSQTKMSKAMRGLNDAIRFGKLIASVEVKETAIETTATAATPALTK